jgi:DNA-binding HxlR family transcriptional regulator
MDAAGERWALLVVRELLFGPKRFSDLHAGLTRMSENVLSSRLRELEAQGVMERVRLAPPANVHAYALTKLGQALEPALVELARWGALLPDRGGAEQSPSAFMLSLEACYAGHSVQYPRSLGIRIGPYEYRVRYDAREIRIKQEPCADEQVLISGDVTSLRRVLHGDDTLTEAIASGRIDARGDESALRQFTALFSAPTL